jgi:hypothetical protein
VILNKKIEACIVQPVIADIPYSVGSVSTRGRMGRKGNTGIEDNGKRRVEGGE